MILESVLGLWIASLFAWPDFVVKASLSNILSRIQDLILNVSAYNLLFSKSELILYPCSKLYHLELNAVYFSIFAYLSRSTFKYLNSTLLNNSLFYLFCSNVKLKSSFASSYPCKLTANYPVFWCNLKRA